MVCEARASGGRRTRPPNPRTESATNREQTVDKLFRIQAVLFESHSALTKKISPPAPPAWRKKRKKVQKSIQKISTRGAAVTALWDSREILAGRAKDTNREGDGKKKSEKAQGRGRRAVTPRSHASWRTRTNHEDRTTRRMTSPAGPGAAAAAERAGEAEGTRRYARGARFVEEEFPPQTNPALFFFFGRAPKSTTNLFPIFPRLLTRSRRPPTRDADPTPSRSQASRDSGSGGSGGLGDRDNSATRFSGSMRNDQERIR